MKSSRITIGFDASRALTDQKTGTETYSFNILKHIADLDNTNLYRIYIREGQPNFRFGKNFAVVPINRKRMWTQIGLANELKRHPVDVLFVPAHVLPVMYRGRSVVTIHDIGYLANPKSYALLDIMYLHWTTHYACKMATAVIAVSEKTKSDIVRVYKCPKEKVHVIYHGVEEGFGRTSKDQTEKYLAEQGIARPYILFLGTIKPSKGIETLIRAWHKLRSDMEVNLILVGKAGKKSKGLVSMIHASGVRWLGYVDRQYLPYLLSGAHVLAMPSLYEGFGLPAVEAMACGTPVLVADSGSLPEVVGDAGIIVAENTPENWYAALRRVITDENLRSSLSQQGRERAKNFSWKIAAEKTLEVLTAATI